MEIINVSQLRVLHTADLHLGRSFRSWGDASRTRQQDLLETLDDIGNLASQHQVHLVLLAGDQFDRHNPDRAILTHFQRWLERLRFAGIQVAIIPGNHDSFWYEDSVYRERFPDNTVIFQDTQCVEPVNIIASGLPVWLYGIAHDHTQERDVLPGFRRRAEEDIHIGLLHATVNPRTDIEVADRYLPLNSSDLASTELDYIALGHLHRSRMINLGQSGIAAYPGSPEPLHIGETGERSVKLITFSGGAPEVTTIPCGRRVARRQEIDVTGLTMEEIIERIAGLQDETLILTAELTGAPKDIPDTDAIAVRVGDAFCYITVADRTSVVDSGYVRQIEHEQTIRGEFVRQMRAQIASAESDSDRAVAELAMQLGLIQLAKRSVE